MTTFMLYFFAFNLRFAPHPQAGSKSRVICFWSATSFRLMSASETVERLTIEIVGFMLSFSCLFLWNEAAARYVIRYFRVKHSRANRGTKKRAEDIPIYSQKMLISPP